MAILITDVYLQREPNGMMRVAVKTHGVWVEVISDNADLASHCVTETGLTARLNSEATELEIEMNKGLPNLSTFLGLRTNHICAACDRHAKKRGPPCGIHE